MSEFKFNCPVCGQHIATDSNASGGQIECPTCFQPIIVPQAPMAQSKYILSATQYIKPQAPPRPPSGSVPNPPPRFASPWLIFALAAACLLAVGAFVLHFRISPPQSDADSTFAANLAEESNSWRLDLSGATIPDAPAAGRVHGKSFAVEHAFLQNGALALRQGTTRHPELLVNIYLPIRESWELSGKHFDIETNIPPLATKPKIVLRWKEADLQVAQIFTNGYVLKLEFGSLAGDRMPGRIYFCAPDSSKSFIAGNFNAEIRKLSFPKSD